MRDPDPKHGPESMRPGRNFNVDLQLRYLSPGAFTVLPPEDVPPPDPPQAPVPYRLTPTTRRNRNQAFSIIAEPHSRTTSRSPSPTGRVSPFRGRGFNPTGSRHASPAPSPPPEIAGDKPPKSPNKKSKIPQIQRRNSSVLFGEKVSHSEEDSDSSPTKNGLNSNLSQSMTNISPSKVSNKPPPSPQKNYVKNPAFRQLSPIIGSSPEPSQSQSSPSRIPTRSRSQPQSRLASPSRPPDGNNGATNSKPLSRTASRNPSRSTSRVQSRNTSREPSPSNKTFISPSKSTKYQNVQPKVNSFIKPKVPTKPTMTSDSELSDKPTTKAPRYKKNVNRVRNSVNKVSASNINTKSNEIKNVKSNEPKRNNKTTTNKKNNIRSDNNNSSVLNSTNLTTATESDFTDVEKKSPFKNKSNVNKPKANVKNTASTGKVKAVDVNSNTTTSEATTDVEGRAGKLKNNDSSIKLLDLMNQASAASIVPSTADTVTKPLKIDANIELSETDLPKGISPMVDGRVLSATSVSHAINKMNDTVLDTKTLMRESGLSKLSPAANAIISMSRENNNNQGTPKITSESSEEATKDSPVSVNHVSKSTPTKNEPDHTEQVNSVPRNSSEATSNHVASVGLMDAKTLEMHVQNSLHKLTAAENSVVNSVQKSVNEKIRETRAVFAPDVKPVQPIQIVVKEKPNDQDVESGNVRLPVSSTNGSLHGRPSLPPDNAPNNNGGHPKPPDPSGNGKENVSRAAKFLASAKDKILCKSCRKGENEKSNLPSKRFEEEDQSKTGCFSCLKKKEQIKQSIKISVEEDGKEIKASCWDRMKCCGTKNKSGEPQGCLPCAKRKPAWEERRDSILSDLPSRITCWTRCKNFMKKLFCLHLCKKKRKFEDLSVSRRASTLSKKKSLTPTALPIEDQTPKLDLSLVEHSSPMKAAIPVLPICLAWFCLVMNCFLPGTGTALSGIFCLCFGKPRFSQKDSMRSRIGAFIIDCIVGFSQCFTILFCLVGWGWSIWWGVIMVKIARKYKKIKLLSDAEEPTGKRPSVTNRNTKFKDPERGS